ncbi:ester cyclase [Sphingomonas lycopersici]|uniref:Ester cyclase n=1 Tax=Sphingomonas lycopersici TaxID=2951807 RepID=A0AA42CV32_9SPHN|nr:ester cyclase [Sphingomonas lycopersici]MCW6536076.1 ester cyclase [Sphingomonas lycopersici]
MTAMERRKQRLAAFIRQVWDEGDSGAADNYIADMYTIHHDPGDPWEGKILDRAGFRDRVRKSRAAFPDQRFDIRGLFADGDSVVMTWLWNGTHQSDLPGFAATGQTIRTSGVTAYMFDSEDRLTGHWQITDRLGVFQQLQRNRQDHFRS